jgi:hypothetical protein
MEMKKIAISAFSIILLASCGGDTGQREHNMQDNQVDAPTSSPQTNTISKDTSTYGTQDSSTVIGYDTSARRKN